MLTIWETTQREHKKYDYSSELKEKQLRDSIKITWSGQGSMEWKESGEEDIKMSFQSK